MKLNYIHHCDFLKEFLVHFKWDMIILLERVYFRVGATWVLSEQMVCDFLR